MAIMNLDLYRESVLSRYKSASQRIRVLSELWFSNNMYCPSCTSNSIASYPNSYPVADFYCHNCNENYQLKSQSRNFGNKVTDGAYAPMIEAVKSNTNPNFFFLHYDISSYKVVNLVLIPHFFMTEHIVEKRNPLRPSARRAGWVGCNILYSRLPNKGKIQVVRDGDNISKYAVRESWKKVFFLNEALPSTRGWLNDIMWCIDRIDKEEFSLNEVYAFESYLQGLHPENKHVKPKIRQQLQILRDKGYLNFTGAGRYQLT